MSTVIVGGGISGLSLAHALVARGVQGLKLLEAAGRVGGTIQTEQAGGFLTESGPNGFLDREPATKILVDALGISDKLRPAAPTSKERFIFTRGALRHIPSSPPAFLSSNVLPLGSRLRIIGELFSGRTREEDESLASFAQRHLGPYAASVLVDAMQSGIFAGDPDALSLKSTFPRMAELEREHRSLILALLRLKRTASPGGPTGTLFSLDGGLSTLTERLRANLGPVIHTNARVAGLTKNAGGAGYQLSVVDSRGQATALSAERVVLASQSHVSAQLLRPLDAELAGWLDEIPYAPVAVVHLGYSQEALGQTPTGFGFLVPHREERRVLGVLYISSIFPWRSPEGHVLLTCMVGGARRGELVSQSEEELITLAKEELQATVGLSAEPLFQRVIRWPKGIPQYNVGHAERLARIDERMLQHPGLFLHGNAYRGVGINDCVRSSGLLAAQLTLV